MSDIAIVIEVAVSYRRIETFFTFIFFLISDRDLWLSLLLYRRVFFISLILSPTMVSIFRSLFFYMKIAWNINSYLDRRIREISWDRDKWRTCVIQVTRGTKCFWHNNMNCITHWRNGSSKLVTIRLSRYNQHIYKIVKINWSNKYEMNEVCIEIVILFSVP